MKVVVTTPTGNVGSRVVRLLIQAGVRPTLLARDPARLDPATSERADVVEADLGDAATVVRVTRGAGALLWVEPPTVDPGADPVAWYSLLGANAARAVTENGIGRTVFLSSIGAEKRSGAGEIDGLARTEEQLDATGATVLHLRCGYFFTNLLGELGSMREGVLRAPMPLDYAQPWVDPRDIGEIAHRPPGTGRDDVGGDSAQLSASGGTGRQAGRGLCRDVGGDARGLRGRGQAQYRHHDTDHPCCLGPCPPAPRAAGHRPLKDRLTRTGG